MDERKTFFIIGGGAAGIFGALTIAECNPQAKVIVIEKTNQLLAKVRISGGGRCNVTHACFDPKLFIGNYPRGGRELLGPFSHFGAKEMIDWLQARQVLLKTEKDGRMFPVSDSSETIIRLFLQEAKRLSIEIWFQKKIESILFSEKKFHILCKNEPHFVADKILLATGSSSFGHDLAASFGHTIINPVPSLFTFHVPHSPLKELSGVSVEKVKVKIIETCFSQIGPILITHFGFSGPSILKLSAWAALYLKEKNYKARCLINWVPDWEETHLVKIKKQQGHLSLSKLCPESFPKQLWKHLALLSQIDGQRPLQHLSDKDLLFFNKKLLEDIYEIDGKTLNKEEFVTAGGIHLKEVNFKTMESKLQKGLYFAGEILNIDGVTGGFNFQNAWTTAWIAAHSF